MSRHSSDEVLVEAERVIRRASWWSVWLPVVIGGVIGVVLALATVAVLLLWWRPDGMGI